MQSVFKIHDFVNFEADRGFASDGAFLRRPDGQIQLFIGPWTICEETNADVGRMDFYGHSTEWFQARQTAVVSKESLGTALAELNCKNSFHKSDFESSSQNQFAETFQIILGKIRRGEIQKAVPFARRRAEIAMHKSSLIAILQALLDVPETLNAYGFWQTHPIGSQTKSPRTSELKSEQKNDKMSEQIHEQSFEGVLGATPEVLFEQRDGLITTMALAGSCPRSEMESRPSLLRDPKEMGEHQWVVDDLEQRLQSLGSLSRRPTEILQLPTLLHLLTKFELRGCRKTAGELAQHLHPTPALGVAPRSYGFHWMQELPGQTERKNFGAPILFRLLPSENPSELLSDNLRKKSDTPHWLALVMIRSLFWQAKKVEVFAGCGLVGESFVDREWQEIMVKMDSIFKMCGID